MQLIAFRNYENSENTEHLENQTYCRHLFLSSFSWIDLRIDVKRAKLDGTLSPEDSNLSQISPADVALTDFDSKLQKLGHFKLVSQKAGKYVCRSSRILSSCPPRPVRQFLFSSLQTNRHPRVCCPSFRVATDFSAAVISGTLTKVTRPETGSSLPLHTSEFTSERVRNMTCARATFSSKHLFWDVWVEGRTTASHTVCLKYICYSKMPENMPKMNDP